ncbi:hypothetical protein QEN19_004402 [Hanseniaspora menglaensis]
MEKATEEQENLVPKQSQKVRTDKPRPHQCNICLRGFVRVEHLKRHALVHTQERPYNCEQCNRKFGRRDLLVRHTKKLHPATQPIETNISFDQSETIKKLENSSSASILSPIPSKEYPFVLPESVFGLENESNITRFELLSSKKIDDELKNGVFLKNSNDSVLPIKIALDKDGSDFIGSHPTRKRVRHSSFSAISGTTYNSSSSNLLEKADVSEGLKTNDGTDSKLISANSFDLNSAISNETEEKGISEVRFSTPPPIYDVLAHPEKHEFVQHKQKQLEHTHNLFNANYAFENVVSNEDQLNSIPDYNQIITNLESIFPMKKFNLNLNDTESENLKNDQSKWKDVNLENLVTDNSEAPFKRRKSNLNFMNLNLSFNHLNIPMFNSKTPTPKETGINKDVSDSLSSDHMKSVSEYQKYLGDQAIKNSPFIMNPKNSHYSTGVKDNADYFNIKDDFYSEGCFSSESAGNQKEHVLKGSLGKLNDQKALGVSQKEGGEDLQSFSIDHNDPWLNKFIESNFEDQIINDQNLSEFNLHFNDIGFDKHFVEKEKVTLQPHNSKPQTVQKKSDSLSNMDSSVPLIKTSLISSVDSHSSSVPLSVKTMSPLEILSNIKSGDLKLSDLDDDSIAALYKVRQISLWKEMLSTVNTSESPSMNVKSTLSPSTDGSIVDLATSLGDSKLVAKSTPELGSILDKINTKHPQNSANQNLNVKTPTHFSVLKANQSIINPIRLKWFNEDLRQQIMDHHKLTQFPTCKELNQYANLYKEEFHAYFDFIHLQSITPSLQTHALLCSIAAIGTLYSFHLYHATQLFVITRHTIRKILEDYTENKLHDIPLWVIQTMVNLSFVEMFHNNKEIISKVDVHFHTLIRIIQITELTKPLEKLQNPPIDGRNIQNDDNEKKKMFEYFIMAQSRIRTCHIVLLVSNLFSALIGLDCRMHSVNLKEGGVPSSQIELFHCNNHLEWFEVLSNKYKITIDSKFSLVELSNGGDSYAHCLRYLCSAKSANDQFSYDSDTSSNFGMNNGNSSKLNIFDTFGKQAPDSLFELENLHTSNLSMFTLMSMLLSIHEKIFIERSKNYSTYQWELKSKPIVINLLNTWKSLFLKNGGVFYDIGTIGEINKNPKLRLLLPLYYFARIRKSINISPILKHIWRKNIDGLNGVLDNLVDSCLSANKSFCDGEDYNRNLLTEATLNCLDTIHLWGETVNYQIDNNKDRKHNISTPIFFITCISSSIIILSVFLQVLELTYKHGGKLSDFEENVWIQSRRILQSLEKKLNSINVDLNRLKLPNELIPPLESISIEELQSWKEDLEKKSLKKHVVEDKLSLKCLYLGLRILLDAPIWPVCLSFGEVLNERGKYLYDKKDSQ